MSGGVFYNTRCTTFSSEARHPPVCDVPEALLQRLRGAKRVAVLTGAGISAESGVPTFRDAQTGLWSRYRPEELATPEAFRRDPGLVWDWYEWRRSLVSRAQPNAGHLALVELERRVPQFTLVTQNVDGLHRRAGSRNVLELHGDIMRDKCFECGQRYVPGTTAGSAPGARAPAAASAPHAPHAASQPLPMCPRCGGHLRPDVVWFGEMLPEVELQEAIEASRRCDMFLCVGTSALVQPAASLPVEALRAVACVVELNPDATPLTPRATFSLRGPSGKLLPEILLRL
jgi:NAD-dependent protein deacetylase/lipoamidase